MRCPFRLFPTSPRISHEESTDFVSSTGETITTSQLQSQDVRLLYSGPTAKAFERTKSQGTTTGKSRRKPVMADPSTSDAKLEVKESDMEDAQVHVCTNIVREAQKLYTIDKDVAALIKERLDNLFGPTWHVIVGRSFGSRVSYEMNNFLLVKASKVNIMMFKCGY